MCGYYETDDLNMAAFLSVMSGQEPDIRPGQINRTVFAFTTGTGFHDLIVLYSTGVAAMNIRRFLSSKHRLLQQIHQGHGRTLQ